MPYFRATEQLVQLTKRGRENEGEMERDGGKEREKGRDGEVGDKTVYTTCTCCPKNNRKGFALNDSEQRLNIY